MKLALFWAAVAVELLGVAAGSPILQWIAKPLMAPILIWYLGRRGPVTPALAFATAGVSARAALGGALFLGSDLLIGVGAAGLDFPGRDLVVMATYAVALFLIATSEETRRPSVSA